MILRGEVYFADIPYLGGSVQSGTRPVVVIQNNVGNYYSTTIVVALITSKRKNMQPTHVEIGLNGCSIVMTEQIQTIDKSMINSSCVYTLDFNELKQLNKALKVSLGLKA